MRRARHIEVQLLGDTHGGAGASVRARLLDPAAQPEGHRARAGAVSRRRRRAQALCDAALAIGKATDYVGAGTVEFLMDADTGAFYFIEVNPRIQVEHTVTEQVTGLDIVKAQIKILEGGRLGRLEETGIPPQDEIRSTATRCNAASRPKIRTIISFPTTAASPPIAAPSASASASTAAPPIPAPSSRASTIRCWRK